MTTKYMSQKHLAERYDLSLRTIQRMVHQLRQDKPEAVQTIGARTRVLIEAADEYLLNKKMPAPMRVGRGRKKDISKEIIA